MNIPSLQLDSTWAGDLIPPSSVESLIPTLAARYGRKYAQHFYGDSDDLEQEARLAFWSWMQVQGEVECVRELQALSVVHNAMQSEIDRTRRWRWQDEEQAGINWRAVVQPDHNLTGDQKHVLFRFRMKASQLAKCPNWEACWLVRGLEWEPVEATLYFRRKPDDRKRVMPDQVMKRVLKAEKRIRAGMPLSLIEEVNRLDWCQ